MMYKFSLPAIALGLLLGFTVYADPLPESPGSDIGYPDVATAQQALLARKDAQSSVQGGWLIVEIPSEMTLWSFAPAGDPAYPAAVKRTVVQGKDGISIDMKVLCQASKEACDDLVRKFERLNEQMKQSLAGHH